MKREVVVSGLVCLVVGALIGGFGVRLAEPRPSFLERALDAIEANSGTAMFDAGRVHFANGSATYVSLDTVRGPVTERYTATKDGNKEPKIEHGSTTGDRRSSFREQVATFGRIDEKAWAAIVKDMGCKAGEASVWLEVLAGGALWTGFECYERERRSYIDGLRVEQPAPGDLAGLLAASHDMALRAAGFSMTESIGLEVAPGRPTEVVMGAAMPTGQTDDGKPCIPNFRWASPWSTSEFHVFCTPSERVAPTVTVEDFDLAMVDRLKSKAGIEPQDAYRITLSAEGTSHRWHLLRGSDVWMFDAEGNQTHPA